MTFYVGQPVSRVGPEGPVYQNDEIADTASYPRVGEVCTISATYIQDGEAYLLFNEHDNGHLVSDNQFGEPGFPAERFRPLVEKGTDAGVALLKKIVDGAKHPVSTRQPEGVV